MSDEHDSRETSHLIDLAKERELIDSAEADGVRIGAGIFVLDEGGTRELLLKMLRYRGDGA